jgi:3-hydroxyacyl-CoA dehydrogenase
VTDGREGVHTPAGSWSSVQQTYVPRAQLPVYERQVFRAPLLGETTEQGHTAGTTVYEDEAVRLWHRDNGILIASNKNKMHAISPKVLDGFLKAVDIAEADYKGLVIWSPDEPFSVGADLQAVLPAFMQGGAKAVEPIVKKFQDTAMRLKYALVPTVAAVSGMALGGGCEFLMHCAKRVANIESYIGLVEIGVGLIPAGGGLKEAALRAAKSLDGATGADPLMFLKGWFTQIAMATVAKSAIDAQKLGYIGANDTIVFNQYELLHVATSEALALSHAGYRPPLAPMIPVAGRSGIATIQSQLVNMRDGGFISAYDFELASKIATVLCGGEVEAGSLVSEQWLLDLERHYFCEALGNPKTQERIMGMLQTGKPVRN